MGSVADVGRRFSIGRCVFVHTGQSRQTSNDGRVESLELEAALAHGIPPAMDVAFVEREILAIPLDAETLRYKLRGVPIVACDSERDAVELLALSGVAPQGGIPARVADLRRRHEDFSPERVARTLVSAGRALNGAALDWLGIRRWAQQSPDSPVSTMSRSDATRGIGSTVGQWINRLQAGIWEGEIQNSRSCLRQWQDLHERHPFLIVRHPPRAVGVVLATRRPKNLLAAVRRVAAQTWPNLSLTVVTHGVQLSAHERDVVRADWADSGRSPEDFTVLEFDSSYSFGAILRAGFSTAQGDLLTKWDDDDLYADTHVEELELLQRLSGSGLVGKAAEFVRLERSQVLIRRFARGAYTHHRDIGGGTLMLTDDFATQFPFDRVPRAVDQHLISRLLESGAQPFRGPGFGYCLVRSTGDHTWLMADHYFLSQALAVYPMGDPIWRAVSVDADR